MRDHDAIEYRARSHGKVTLHLATPTVEGLPKLYESLTERSLSPESLEELKKIVEKFGPKPK